jgi:hypothetical protein
MFQPKNQSNHYPKNIVSAIFAKTSGVFLPRFLRAFVLQYSDASSTPSIFS